MKKLAKLFILFLAVNLTNFVQASADVIHPIHPTAIATIIPAGTPVFLELNQSINSEHQEVGHSVKLRIRSNVVVNGKVVIATGTVARGRVVEVQKSCNLCEACPTPCGRVVIEVQSTTSVNGSAVYLEGSPHLSTGKCCGVGPATIPIGTVLDATVREFVKA